MKKYILFFSILGAMALSVSAQGQCDVNTAASPIKCGYYTEGYQDGANDARSNRSDDYRRYRSKYERQYEDLFRDGYRDGYLSGRPTVRWTFQQRSAYDAGYGIGQGDRRRSARTRETEIYGAGYDETINLYFKQGYSDGYYNRPRTYDVVVAGYPPTNPPPFPGPGGGSTGSATWQGRVDDRGNILIRGNTIYTENVSGNGTQTTYQNLNGVLPRRPVNVTARKRDGRGNVTVIEQPSRANNFTAVIQVYDSGSGADNYSIDITWSGGILVEEPYSRGNVTWRGRVDQTAQIAISGSDVQSQDISRTGLTNVDFSINGHLAYRPGSVTVRKRDGRGSVTILQQPSRLNDYTAIIEIFDPNSGSDNYSVEISW